MQSYSFLTSLKKGAISYVLTTVTLLLGALMSPELGGLVAAHPELVGYVPIINAVAGALLNAVKNYNRAKEQQ